MKFIHTSDWHLGRKLHNYDRGDEQERFLEQLRDLAARERPDALVVAGDVFDGAAPSSETCRMFVDRLLAIQEASPGMTTVVIAGNHDSYSRLTVDEALWVDRGVRVVGRPAEDAGGLAVFGDNLVEIAGKGWIAAVPFCSPRNFPAVADAAPGADRQRAYFEGLRAAAEEASGGLPLVLAAHLAVGRETDFTGQDRGLVIGGEECAEPADLGAKWDYAALGHIHCPQFVKGTEKRVRYCGTPMAMSFDEAGHPHGADVVEVATRGAAPSVRTVRFEPLRELRTLGGESGGRFEDLLAEIPRAGIPKDAYLRLRVAPEAGGAAGADWEARARGAAEAAGLRFCCIKIAAAENAPSGGGAPPLTVDELRELSDGRVVELLAAATNLTDDETDLLRGVLADLSDPERATTREEP